MFEYFKRNKRLPQQKVLNIMCRFKTILYVLLNYGIELHELYREDALYSVKISVFNTA